MKKFVIFIMFFVLCNGCLITNCPRGGKRGDTIFPLENFAKDCTSCGPNRTGRCFGPHICCGATFGCLVGTPDTYECHKESLFSRPCIAGYAMCRGNTARCAANGVCCSQESCFIDAACRLADVNADRKGDIEFGVISAESEIFAD